MDEELNICLLCKDGYTERSDGKCDLLEHDNCQSGFGLKNIFFEHNLKYFNEGFKISLKNKNFGCSMCQNNYTKVFYNHPSHKICLSSKRMTDINIIGNTSLLNCKIVDFSSKFPFCVECQSDYILNFSEKNCISKNSLPKCFIAWTKSRCKKCINGYFLNLNGQCEKIQIDNCLNFYEERSVQICLDCNEGFYNYRGKCIEGRINHCKIYFSFDICIQCDINYYLSEDQSNCIPIPENLKCQNLFLYNSNEELNCLECASSVDSLILLPESSEIYFYEETDNFLQNCDQIISSSEEIFQHVNSTNFYFTNLIELEFLFQDLFLNKTEYAPLNNFTEMKCIKCSDDYYLDIVHNICHKRNSDLKNCLIKSNFSDTCFECNVNYFWSEELNLCSPLFEKILNCNKFSNESKCLICSNDTYPVQGICSDVPEKEKIQNCMYYSEGAICVKCESPKIITNNRCLDPIAKNCLTYSNHFRCSECPSDYILIESNNNILNCERHEIPNCLKPTKYDSFDSSLSNNIKYCEKCESGFYPHLGRCLMIEHNIPNCKYYFSASICTECIEGYSLSIDRVSCLKESSINYFSESLNTDKNCLSYQKLSNPKCIICKIGFFLYQGSCRECEADNCLQCDPLNSKNCVICKSGSSMMEHGVCILNEI